MIESRKEEDLRKPIEETQQKKIWDLFLIIIAQLNSITDQIRIDIDADLVRTPEFYKNQIESTTTTWVNSYRDKWRADIAKAITDTIELSKNQLKEDTGIDNITIPPMIQSLYLEAGASALNNVIFDLSLGFAFIVDAIMVWNWQKSLVSDYKDGLIRKSNDKVEFISTNTILKVYTNSLMEMCMRAGIDGYIWQTMEDNKVRPTHAANNGKYFTWKRPSPITGKPGDEPNCRCLCRIKKV